MLNKCWQCKRKDIFEKKYKDISKRSEIEVLKNEGIQIFEKSEVQKMYEVTKNTKEFKILTV